jgi:hypothetical protein
MAHSDAPANSLLARPRRCSVLKMRYNEFGKHSPNLFYQNQRFTVFLNYSGYRIILFSPLNIFEKVGG